MSTTRLLKFFAEHKQHGDPLVLASVFETAGSTYSKTGAGMLISGDGDFQGMLSGGCLEGDLAARAKQVIESGQPQQVSYDLSQDDEALWGLGVGCDGLMRIFLQPLLPAGNYEPFATMADRLQGERTEIAAIVIESASELACKGDALVSGAGCFTRLGLPSTTAAIIEPAATAAMVGGYSVTRSEKLGDDAISVLYVLLKPPSRVLVLGAGLDAEPVVNLCAELGWRVTLQDHRPAYIEKGDFSKARQVLCNPASSLAEVLDLRQFDAAIVMSHHLVTDGIYLQLLAQTEMTYIGLLGPGSRRNRIVGNLGATAARLDGRLHGPAGLDIGGRGPAAIALSIVAEMHEKLAAPERRSD
ncbi:MAG: XdhC family protein [Gammaproteobacteria bacterium]|nr:XdhC family protein [Gammaproteobacteria bacterium]